MEITQQQRKGWLYTCTTEERLAVWGVIEAWARQIGGRTDLAPLESREMYRVFADELRGHVREGYGTELTADRSLSRQWSRLGISSKEIWVSGSGQWLPFEPPGWHASRVICNSLVPGHFDTFSPVLQRNLAGQIAREIEGHLQRDPGWYGHRSEEYRTLGAAARWLEQRGDSQLYTNSLRWDHMDNPQRGSLLIQIRNFAHRAGLAKRLDPQCRTTLQELSGSAGRVADHIWPRSLER
jgi:hypothetical protein